MMIAASGRLVLRSCPRWAAGWSCPSLRRLLGRAAASPRSCHRGSDWGRRHCRGLGRPAWRGGARIWVLSERQRRTARRVPGVALSGLGPADPVMYLPWTDDVPVVYPPCTCAVRTASQAQAPAD